MSKALAKPIALDPEYEAILNGAKPEETAPVQGQVRKLNASEDADNGQALIEMAQENQKLCHRQDFRPGSFDQIEHDVSNAGRLIYNFFTR